MVSKKNTIDKTKSKGDKIKQLQDALGQIDRQFGEGAVMRMGDKVHVKIPSISTGSILKNSSC